MDEVVDTGRIDGVEPDVQDTESEVVEPVSAKSEEDKLISDKPRTQHRFQDLLIERNKYRLAAEQAQAELARLKAPTLEEFDHDIEAYTDAKIEHNTHKQDAVRAAGTADTADKTASAAIMDEWQRIGTEASARYPDFAQVAGAPDVPISMSMAEAMMNSDAAGDLAYYLGKHKDEAARIANLPPSMQGYEIAKLESRVKPGAIESKAPSPPTHRTSGTAASGSKSWETMSDAEFSKMRREQREAYRANH